MGNKLKETIYMTALSVLQSHLWYPEIELYVDETAYRFLHMLPCRVTLIPHNKDAEMWMKVKLQVIAMQNKPFVHLDTDIILSKNIDFNFDKILLERKENSYDFHYKPQLAFFNKYLNHFDFWHTDLQKTFSCGVIGFNDMILRNEFMRAFSAVEEAYKIFKNDYQDYKNKGFEPCIVIEQYTLACLLESQNIKPDLLLRGSNIFKHVKQAKEIGFNHLFGIKKYEEHIINQIEERLKKVFPFWYYQVRNELEKHQASHKMKLTF